MQRKLSFLLALLAIILFGVNGAKAATEVTIPTASGTYINWGDADLTKCKTENNGASVGSTHAGTIITFNIKNTVRQDYVMSFLTGASGLTAELGVTLSDDARTYLDATANVENTNSWTPSTPQAFVIKNLPVGNFTLTIKVNSTTGGYAGNYGNLAFTPLTSYDQIPDPGTIDINKGAYKGARVENSTNVGYVANDCSASYTFYNNATGAYTLNMEIARYNKGGNLNIVIKDLATGAVDVNQDYTIAADAPGSYTDTPIQLDGTISEGLKSMTFTFTKGNSFICNFKNIRMSYAGASAPVNKNASRQLSVEKLDYKSGVNSKNGALDRTTRGLSLKFNGGDGIKFNGDSYGINWRYKNASVTVGLDPDAIKSSGSDAKITRVVFSTNTASKDINLNNISMDADGDITLADSCTGPNAGSGAFIVFTPKNPVKSLTATETDSCNINLTNFFVEYEYSNGKDLPDHPTTVMPSENDIVIVALEGKSSASQSLKLPNTSVGNLGGTHNNKSVWSYEITSSDGTKNPAGLQIASVSDGLLTVNATTVGIYTVTATYTPTKENYFTWGATDDNKETFTVRVIDHTISSGEWIFDATLNNGDGIGHNQKFSSDLWSETTVTDILDSKKTYKAYDLTNGINDDAKPLTTDGSNVVSHTEGLDFRSTLGESLVVVPDHSLRMDENSSIVIRNIKPSNDEGTTYILIDAQPTDGHGGFEVDKKMPISFYNEELSSTTNRQVFMLKVKSSTDVTALDVTLWPSDGMEIYKIEVTQKKVPTFTVEVSGDDLSSYTATDENKVTKTIYKVNYGKPFNVTFKTKETYLKGKLMVYALGDLVDGSAVEEAVASGKAGTATFHATGKNGGGAVFVAKFTPDASETTYTYGYATVIVDIGDKTMYRVGFGQSANVGDVITSVDGIKMYIDGWEGAEGAPAEYRIDGTADKWTKARKEAYIETFPGYDYTFSANENSADETQTQYINKNAADYRNEPYWYDEKNIPNNPYMMPVFGGFLKFVPSVNGTLKVYIHQNGAVCSIKHKDGTQTITPYIIHMRSYYIGDETGKLYTDADNVTAVTKARLATLWNTKGKNMRNLLGTIPTNNPDQEDDTDYATDMPQYQADIDFFKKAIGDRDVPQDEVQTVYCKNGGWVMFNEGATEYTIPNVKAGKTYYVFTNRTKLGFYGFRFTPDENVTEVTITPSAEGATSYTLTKSSEPAAGASVAYKVDQSFKRELNAGMWNTLCLPFSLNEDQTKAALPEGFEIVDFYSVKNDKLTFKKHYYQMIDAGRPYLIWIPGKLGEKYDMKFQFPTGTTGYVAYDNKTSGLNPINVNGEDDSADKYVWTGTYQQMSLPKNAYFVAQNPDNGKTVIKQNVSGKSQTKGYRAYLVAASGVTPVKALSIDYDGVDEEVTTGIDDIMADLTDPETTGKVYNLGGQLVSRNGLQSLPKGIYIMNGKKYVVK